MTPLEPGGRAVLEAPGQPLLQLTTAAACGEVSTSNWSPRGFITNRPTCEHSA